MYLTAESGLRWSHRWQTDVLTAYDGTERNRVLDREGHPLGGLYAIGEAVDVTGWLGGYNFQWAWASAAACARALVRA